MNLPNTPHSHTNSILLDAIRQSLQGIIMMKSEKISTWNRGAKFIFGYKESEVIGNSLSGIFMKEDIRRIYNTVDEDRELEVLGKRKDGERLALILTIIYSKEEPDTCVILLRDISHIRKSEEMIGQKHEYLMQTVKEYGIIKRKVEYFQEMERLFFQGGTDLQKIYDFFVYSVAHIAWVWWCWLRILDHETMELLLVADYWLGTMRNGSSNRSYTGSICEESYTKSKPIRVLDLISDPRLRSLSMAQVQRFRSATMYAFRFHEQCLGSIMLFMEDGSDPFDDEFLMHYIELFGLLLGGRKKE